MLKILGYLKQSFFQILIIIVLLFVQAICDISLPDYTAKMVNIGIQQSGIENVAPEIVREAEMNKIFLFMDDNEIKKVLENYQLLTPTKTEPAYPLLASEPLYKGNESYKANLEELNRILTKPILMVHTLESNSGEAKEVIERFKALFNINQDIELSVFNILSFMSLDQRREMLKEVDERLSKMPESIINQSVLAFVKKEYDTIGFNTDKMRINYILNAGTKMLGLSLIGVLAAIIVTLLSAQVSTKLAMSLRSRVFSKVLSFSNRELDKFGVASLITRATNDIQQIQIFVVMLLRMVIFSPILGIGGFIKILNTNSLMSWTIGVGILSVLSLVIVLFSIAIPRFIKLQLLVDKLNLVSREILTGLSVIRAFNNQKHEEKRFDKANLDLTRVNLFVNRTMTIMMPTMMFIMNGLTILIVWVGAEHIEAGRIQVGDMMAFMQYAIQIVMSFLMLSMVSVLMPRASVSGNRIAEVLDMEISIKEPKEPKNFTLDTATLEFKDVCFRYPEAEENVLDKINFTAKPGEVTAIIGSTGSGKTTVINLISRFFDVTSGEILINGINIKDIKLYDLRNILGFVPQKGVLFSGTIESNIKFSEKDAEDEEMECAAKIAQASEFIENKPERYKSEISQGGSNVSGGQRQRLSIARAIMKKPKIYIFDDSFSALDYKTDSALRGALKEVIKTSTVIIVAQRINTILDANQIIVLDDGKIAGCGTHKELLESCEVYYQIASSQLSKEELAI